MKNLEIGMDTSCIFIDGSNYKYRQSPKSQKAEHSLKWPLLTYHMLSPETGLPATSQHVLQMSLPFHTILFSREPGCRPTPARPLGDCGWLELHTHKQENGTGKHWDGFLINHCLYSLEPASHRCNVLLAPLLQCILCV